MKINKSDLTVIQDMREQHPLVFRRPRWECRESVIVLASAMNACGDAQTGSLVWAKASHQSSTESHAWGDNQPCETEMRDVRNASEDIKT